VFHVVAAPRLARSDVPASVVRDATESVAAQKQHLVVPRVSGQRPAVTEHNGLPCSLTASIFPVSPAAMCQRPLGSPVSNSTSEKAGFQSSGA
jgi:hypothetical protein